MWVKTNDDAHRVISRFLEDSITLSEISLDHDLGEGQDTRFIVWRFCLNERWPDKVHVHTMNPVGREWLEGMVARYKPDV